MSRDEESKSRLYSRRKGHGEARRSMKEESNSPITTWQPQQQNSTTAVARPILAISSGIQGMFSLACPFPAQHIIFARLGFPATLTHDKNSNTLTSITLNYIENYWFLTSRWKSARIFSYTSTYPYLRLPGERDTSCPHRETLCLRTAISTACTTSAMIIAMEKSGFNSPPFCWVKYVLFLRRGGICNSHLDTKITGFKE